MTIEGNAAIYRAALERANAGDLAGYLDLYSDDVVFGGVTPEPLDKAGVVAFHENFYSAFPNLPSPRSSRCATASASNAGRRPTCSAC